MFDDQGRPQGYGQYSPFTDQPQAPGAQADPNAIPGAGAGTPSHPVDPTLNGWRSGGMGGRQLGQPHLPMAPPLAGAAPTPLQNAIQPKSAGQSQAEGGLGAQQFGPGQRNPITGGVLGPNQGGSISGPFSFGLDSNTSHPVGQPSSPVAGGVGSFAAGSDQQRTRDLLAKYKSTDDPTYWDKVEQEHGGFDATGQGWLDDAIMRGDGAEGVRNGSVQKRGAKSNRSVMSAIAPGLQNPASDPSLSQTGSSNPLLAAIRQSLGQKKVSSYGV